MNQNLFNAPSGLRDVCALCFLAIIIFLQPHGAFAEPLKPVTLQDGLKIVTEENRVIKIARFSEDMAFSDVKIARSAMLPTINASGSYTSMHHPPTSIINGTNAETADSHSFGYSITISQILFDFRASLSRYDASRMMLEAKKLDTAKIRNGLAWDFTSSFYDYLESLRLVEASTRELESVEAHLQNAKRLHENGVITRNDLLQAQVRLSDSRQKLLSAKNLQSVRSAKLNNFLNRPLSAEFQAVEPDTQIAPPDVYNPEEAWKEASGLRPDILIVDRTIDANDYETMISKADFLPRFYVRGSNDYVENTHLRYENNWSVMLSMNINLFNGGKTLASIQKSQSRKKQLLEQRARLAEAIQLELQNYSLNRDNAYARFLTNKDAAGQAAENLRINKKRYEQGMGTATEVLDAIALTTLAETNYIRSIYDCRRAAAALHYAMGRNLADVYR